MVYWRSHIIDFLNKVGIDSISPDAPHLLDEFYQTYFTSKGIQANRGNVATTLRKILNDMYEDGVLQREPITITHRTHIGKRNVYTYLYHLPNKFEMAAILTNATGHTQHSLCESAGLSIMGYTNNGQK